MFIFYQPINFYIVLNLILFIADYPDIYIRQRKHATDTNYIVKSYRLHFVNKNHIYILIW